MKQFILYLFILLPFCVNSQVNETFDGPMLGADWIGKDRGQFVVNADGRLQLNIKPTESGTASIGKEIAYSPDMQWEFDVYMQNQPSDENKFHASARWDDKAERVVFERKEPPQTPAEPEQPDAAKATETPHGDAGKGSRKKKSASDAS